VGCGNREHGGEEEEAAAAAVVVEESRGRRNQPPVRGSSILNSFFLNRIMVLEKSEPESFSWNEVFFVTLGYFLQSNIFLSATNCFSGCYFLQPTPNYMIYIAIY
jgi:hypothetical protein